MDSDQNLNDLNDVEISSPLNSQALIYQASTGLWINATQSGAGGGGRTYSGASPVSVDNDQNVIALNVLPNSDWNGTFDGQQGTYYLNWANDNNRLFSLLTLDNNSSFDARYNKTVDSNNAGRLNFQVIANPPWLQVSDYNVSTLQAGTFGGGLYTFPSSGGRFIKLDPANRSIIFDGGGTANLVTSSGNMYFEAGSGAPTFTFKGTLLPFDLTGDSIGGSGSNRWQYGYFSKDVNAWGDINARTLLSASGFICDWTTCYKLSDMNNTIIPFNNITNRLFSLLTLDSNGGFDLRYLNEEDYNVSNLVGGTFGAGSFLFPLDVNGIRANFQDVNGINYYVNGIDFNTVYDKRYVRIGTGTQLSSGIAIWDSVAGILKFSDATVTNGTIITGSQLVSTTATGSAPFVVSSTTLVSNLNADILDGQHGSYYLIDTNIFSSGVADCNSTSFVFGFNSNGTIDCRTDLSGGGGSSIDTNTVTAGWTNSSGKWLIDLNTTQAIYSDKNVFMNKCAVSETNSVQFMCFPAGGGFIIQG